MGQARQVTGSRGPAHVGLFVSGALRHEADHEYRWVAAARGL